MRRSVSLSRILMRVGKAQLVRMLTGLGVPFAVYGIMAGIGFPFEGLMWATAVCFCILGWRVVADDALDGFAGISALLVLVEFSALFLQRHHLLNATPALYAVLLGCGLSFFAVLRFPLFQALAEDVLDISFFPEVLHQSPYYGRCWRMVNIAWAVAFFLKGALLFALQTLPALDGQYASLISIIRVLMGWPFLVLLIALSVLFIRRYWHRKRLWVR